MTLYPYGTAYRAFALTSSAPQMQMAICLDGVRPALFSSVESESPQIVRVCSRDLDRKNPETAAFMNPAPGFGMPSSRPGCVYAG
jgi:hypothetical protein